MKPCSCDCHQRTHDAVAARRKQAIDLHKLGASWAQIGRNLGCTPENARVLVVGKRRVQPRKLVIEESHRAPLVSVAVCVCGALKSLHANGRGSCRETGCREYYERGQ